MTAEDWGEKEICIKESVVHSDTKSNMANRINDRELITIARPDETLALQATQ